ncbi:histidine--tRNA ligase [Omnitrophica bacterium]|nr:histidine--tRNA ligase [Candidatus Omnitrophota bacterium]
MSSRYEALRGMEDILPGEVEKWQWVEENARIFFESRSYKEIRTPLLEHTDLFVRSVGESSDIVNKEMFSFEDRGGRNVTLRPEMTASVARAVIEKGLLKQAKSLRLYYLGPMFRAERPQAGRKRQFHQVGIEIINESDGAADFECITALAGFFKYLSLEDWVIRINDLGDAEVQKKTAEGLKKYFEQVKKQLCSDCQWRLTKNVLRIFDCKNAVCQPVIEKAPWDQIAPLSGPFQELMQKLQAHHLPLKVDRRLVRGLDYYNGAVFEVACQGLGAQDAVAGGGRYDRLYGDLGSSRTPCTGFSIGMERLLTALEKSGSQLESKIRSKRVYLALLDSGCKIQGEFNRAALALRQQGVRIEMTAGETSLSKHLKKANKLNVRYALLLGNEEMQKGIWVLKDLDQKTQQDLKWDGIVSHFQGV